MTLSQTTWVWLPQQQAGYLKCTQCLNVHGAAPNSLSLLIINPSLSPSL
uniref:Uncharacterized protein n=1 Tax=Anguilla anguilla TaxID=7936 RepID=A0A0E9VMS6_ANGAN